MFASRFSSISNGSRSDRRNTASSTTSQGSVTFPSHALRYSVLLQQPSQQQQQPSQQEQSSQQQQQQQQPLRPPSREANAQAKKIPAVIYVNERLRRFEDLLAQKAPREMINAAYQTFLRAYETCDIDVDDPSESHETQKLRQNLRFSRWCMSKLLRPEYTTGFVDCNDGCIVEEDLFDEREVVDFNDDWCDASFAAANASASSDDDADSIDTLSDIIPYYEDATIVQEPAPFAVHPGPHAVKTNGIPRTQPAVVPARRAVTLPSMPGAHLTRQSKINVHEPIMESNDWQEEYFARYSWI